MYTRPGVYAGSVPMPGAGFSLATYAYVALIDPATSGATLCLGGSASYGLSFGYLLPQTTPSQAVQVTNCGSAPLTFTSIASNNTAFTLPAGSNSCTGSLAVGASCAVSLVFAPTAVQAYSGQLTFMSNASISTTSISLSGSGGEPVAGFGPPGMTQTLIFPSTLVGQSSSAHNLSVSDSRHKRLCAGARRHLPRLATRPAILLDLCRVCAHDGWNGQRDPVCGEQRSSASHGRYISDGDGLCHLSCRHDYRAAESFLSDQHRDVAYYDERLRNQFLFGLGGLHQWRGANDDL
jgi:hypothetical protein